MNREEILSHVDHTLLKPEATWPQIQQLCDEAIANHTASVCINTCYVRQAVEYMAGRIPVCCVVGFPLGAMDTASKAFEARTAIENGAAEYEDLGALRDIGAGRDHTEEVDIELVDGHRCHGVGEGDGLELDVAPFLFEVAELIGQDSGGDLDQLAGDGADKVLALALAHECFFLRLFAAVGSGVATAAGESACRCHDRCACSCGFEEPATREVLHFFPLSHLSHNTAC